MINEHPQCGHSICSHCVNILFHHQAKLAKCPTCNTLLEKRGFKIQEFEDSRVEIDNQIRKKLYKELAHRMQDELGCYDDNLLEEFEVLVYNLTNNVDVAATRARIASLKTQHNTK
jgi:hypothetical protein